MSKDNNLDYHSDFKEAIENNAVLVNCLIEGEKYPKKPYRKTRWNLTFQENSLLITETIRKNEENTVMKIDFNQIREIEVEIAKQFLGEFPGPFATTFLVSKLRIKYLLTDKEIVLLCEGLAAIPPVIAYIKKSEVPIRDVLSLEELFSQKGGQAAKEYLEKHYDKLAQENGIEATVYQNRKNI